MKLSDLEHKATVNPLHISQDAPTVTPSPPPGSKGRHVFQYIVRFIMFSVAPLLYVWQMENSFVQTHLLILTYIQVLYIVVFQGVLIQSFLDQRSKIIKMILVTVILYTSYLRGLPAASGRNGGKCCDTIRGLW